MGKSLAGKHARLILCCGTAAATYFSITDTSRPLCRGAAPFANHPVAEVDHD